MNYTTAVFLINPAVRAVTVSYEPSASNADVGASATVFKTVDPTIRPKDLVIVPTNTRWRFTVARVEAVDVDVDYESTTAVDWIVEKVERHDYEATLRMEQDAIQTIRSAEVRQKREALAKALLADNEGLTSLPIANLGAAALEPPPEPVRGLGVGEREDLQF